MRRIKSEHTKLVGVALAAAVATALLVILVAARSAGPSPDAMLRQALDSLERSRGWRFRENIHAWMRGSETVVDVTGSVNLEKGELRSVVVVKPPQGAPRMYMYYSNKTHFIIIYQGSPLTSKRKSWSVEDTVLYKAFQAAAEGAEKELHRRDDGIVVVSSGRPSVTAEELYASLYAMAYPDVKPPRPDTAEILVHLSENGEPRGFLVVYYRGGDRLLQAVYIVEDYNKPPSIEKP